MQTERDRAQAPPFEDRATTCQGRDAQIEDIKTLLRNMAEAGLEILCYNWMPDEDWQRTSKDVPERGGAKVTAFDLSQIAKENPTDADGLPPARTPADRLWDNLKRFLDEILTNGGGLQGSPGSSSG